jgi:hypothetical protein
MLNLVSASNLSNPIFLGYCAKQIWVPTEEWCSTWGAPIPEIASVSDCLSNRAPNWVDRWDFNRSTFWNDENLALAAVPAEGLPHFRLFCYRLLPTLFGASGEPKSVSIDDLFTEGLPGLPNEPDLSEYRTLGYDIVEAPLTLSVLGFGCSPLSCNGMAGEIAVNQYCLVEDLDNAFAIAKRFGARGVEPGPYAIIEVLQRS